MVQHAQAAEAEVQDLVATQQQSRLESLETQLSRGPSDPGNASEVQDSGVVCADASKQLMNQVIESAARCCRMLQWQNTFINIHMVVLALRVMPCRGQ